MSEEPVRQGPHEPANWKSEYDQQQRKGLATAYRNRWISLVGLVGCMATMIYVFIRPYGQERWGILALMSMSCALFGGMFLQGNSRKARAAAADFSGHRLGAPATPEDARLMRKLRWLAVPGVIALLSKEFVPQSSVWHMRVQIGGIVVATIGFLAMPYVLMSDEIHRARRDEENRQDSAPRPK